MGKKKIIIGAVLVLMLLAISIISLFSSRKEEGAETTSSPAVQLPVGDPNASIATSSGDAAGTKETFEKYVSSAPQAKLSDEGYVKTQIKNKDNQPIALDTFLKATGSSVYPKISGLLNENDYYLVNCGKGNYGLILNVKLFDSYTNLYQDELSWMEEWEKSMLEDLHSVLFPDATFAQKDLEQKAAFKDGKYRYADITLPDGSKSSINYNIVFDSIIITNSVNCLEKVSTSYESLEP